MSGPAADLWADRKLKRHLRPKKHSREELPGWFHRLLPKHEAYFDEDNWDKPSSVGESDFDEDLSSLEEDDIGIEVELDDAGQEEAEKQGYVCSEDESYDGSDAEAYYELKEKRDDYKQTKKEAKNDHESEIRYEEEMEIAVRDALRRAGQKRQKGQPLDIKSMGRHGFDLFCCDHVKQFYGDLYSSKSVSFYNSKRWSAESEFMGDSRTKRMRIVHRSWYGVGDLCRGGEFVFEIPNPREVSSLTPVMARTIEGHHELSVTFISDAYVILRIPRAVVFGLASDLDYKPFFPPNRHEAPEVFDFYGIAKKKR